MFSKFKILLATGLLTFSGVSFAEDTKYELTIENGVYTFTPSTDTPSTPTTPTTPVPVQPDTGLEQIEYCQNFDTSQGLTFDYLDWQEQCDTNRDGEYKFCEDWVYTGPITFEAVWWNRGCKDDQDFSPVN